MKAQKLNIYQLSSDAPGIAELAPADATPDYEPESESLSGDFKYSFFVQRNAIRHPSWHSFFLPIIDNEKPSIRTSSASFVLFVQNGENKYAITGGFGFQKLPKEYVVDDFGLQMASRLIDPDQINGLTQKAMKGPTRQIHRALVGYKHDLDLDNYNRLLRALEGKTIDERFGVSITGKKSLSFSKKLKFDDLKDVFTSIEDVLSKSPIVEFPESFKLIEDKEQKSTLNNLLVAEFNRFLNGEGDRDRLYLELRDLFAQFQCHKFDLVVKSNVKELEYFSLENIRNILLDEGISEIANVEALKQIKVIGTDEHNHIVLDEEPLLDMLVYELDHSGDFYLLNEKKWYKLLDGWKQYIDAEISKIPKLPNGSFPDWLRADHERENSYNNFVGSEKGYQVLDADKVMVEGRSNIEVCDLYDKEGNSFIHVKRAWGSKTSYLFTQGLISGEFNYSSAEFRDKCKEKWPDLFDGVYRVGANIIFVVVDTKSVEADFPRNLSYFAKLSLVQTTSTLRNLGYNVSIAGASYVEAPSVEPV